MISSFKNSLNLYFQGNAWGSVWRSRVVDSLILKIILSLNMPESLVGFTPIYTILLLV